MKSLTKGLLPALALCTFFSFRINAQVVDKIIAKVDNQILLKSELEMSYLQYLASSQASQTPNLKCQVLESLLINKLLIAKAAIDSVTVDKSVVEDQLNRRMDYFIHQIGSQQKLEEYYGKTIEQLKSELRVQVKEQMLIQKMQDNITSKVTITPKEVKNFFNKIPKDSLPYFSSEVEVGHIVITPQISREQKMEARKKLELIREKVLAGDDFCKFAKIYSEDPGSAKQCGELGFFKKGDLVPEYESAALRLKPNEISNVIESEYGFHLIQLIERRANEFNTRHILIKPVSSTKDLSYSTKFLDSIRTLILKDSITFEKAAKKYSSDKATVGSGGFFLDEMTGSSKISVEDLDPGLFFTIDTMEAGEITQPIPYRTPDGVDAVRIIYLKSKTPPHVANLRDDYQKIYLAALNEKKAKAVNEWFDKTKGEVYIDIDDEYKDCELEISQ
ncbi:MAG TPA: peptidylprolyl isomerase [Cytophagaceae bacterium]